MVKRRAIAAMRSERAHRIADEQRLRKLRGQHTATAENLIRNALLGFEGRIADQATLQQFRYTLQHDIQELVDARVFDRCDIIDCNFADRTLQVSLRIQPVRTAEYIVINGRIAA